VPTHDHPTLRLVNNPRGRPQAASPPSASEAGLPGTDHPQVVLRLPARVGGGRAEVDRELAPLLQEIWRRGWRTWRCRVDGDGIAEVVFARGADVAAFLAEAEICAPVQVKVIVPGFVGALIEYPLAVYLDRPLVSSIAEQMRLGDGFVYQRDNARRPRRTRR
jgi:hypothetical protein